jgi:ribosomal protein S18 acetylase RimI-like enzyme
MGKIRNSISIEELSENNLMDFYHFFQKNEFQSEYFYPHAFTLDYLDYALTTKDAYFIMSMGLKVSVAYGLLRGWEEGYEVPRLGVAVDKNFRHFGFGEFMCKYLHAYAKYRGCKQVRLRVYQTNEVAKSLYDKLGYKFHVDTDDPRLLEGMILL